MAKTTKAKKKSGKIQKASKSGSQKKETVKKIMTGLGIVGLGAAIFAKRDKIKQAIHNLITKVKKVP